MKYRLLNHAFVLAETEVSREFPRFTLPATYLCDGPPSD